MANVDGPTDRPVFLFIVWQDLVISSLSQCAPVNLGPFEGGDFNECSSRSSENVRDHDPLEA